MMLALVGSATSFVAHHRPISAVAPAAVTTHSRCDDPAVMVLTPSVRGALVGGAAVSLVNLLRKTKLAKFDASTPVSKADVEAAQKLWAESIASISKVYADEGDFVAAAGEAAMSYFVGAEAMKNDAFKGEDAGFAINGGRGWKDVTFRNHQIELFGTTAHAMGDYVFTDATSGDKVRVEYTFVYKRCEDGEVRICLHHSSVPYAAAGPAPVSEKE